MSGRAEDWRDGEIGRLDKRLHEAEQKIRELERRPFEWMLKAEMAILWILVAVIWIVLFIEIASTN